MALIPRSLPALFMSSIVLGWAGPAAGQVTIPGPERCWAVADGNAEETDGDAPDLLVAIDRADLDPATNEVPVGLTGTFDMEAIALQPATGVLFAADAGTLGTVDILTGIFTPGGDGIGSGDGSDGRVTFSDVDGLHFDPTSGLLYGSQRRARDNDLLLRIDPLTGAVVAGAFSGDDYVMIEALPDDISDIDDLAVDPTDGQMYASANDGGRRDRLVKIDKATGAVTDVGRMGQEDVEGLSFAPDGQLIGTTGRVHDAEAIIDIDKATGAAGNVRPLGEANDYEGLACLVVPIVLPAPPAEAPVPPVAVPTPRSLIPQETVEPATERVPQAVSDPPPAPGPVALPELPRTGDGARPLSVLAGVTLMLGGLGVALGRTRRRP